jgi:hypothetical protein
MVEPARKNGKRLALTAADIEHHVITLARFIAQQTCQVGHCHFKHTFQPGSAAEEPDAETRLWHEGEVLHAMLPFNNPRA